MVYLLTGENTFVLEQRLHELVSEFNGDVEHVDGSELTIDALPDLLVGATLFDPQRRIVLKNTAVNKPVWSVLGEWLGRAVENDIVIVEPDIDKRTKLYKWLDKHAEVFVARALQPHEVVAWVTTYATTRHLTMDRATIQFFVDYVGSDQWRLASELDKLALSHTTIDVAHIRAVVEPTPQATSFELLDAVCTGQRDVLERLLTTIVQQEDPYMFFGLLSGHIYATALMKTADGRAPEGIASQTGVHPFVLKKSSVLARRLSITDVQQLVFELAELDSNMKSRPVDPWIQIEAFLLRLVNRLAIS